MPGLRKSQTPPWFRSARLNLSSLFSDAPLHSFRWPAVTWRPHRDLSQSQASSTTWRRPVNKQKPGGHYSPERDTKHRPRFVVRTHHPSRFGVLKVIKGHLIPLTRCWGVTRRCLSRCNQLQLVRRCSYADFFSAISTLVLIRLASSSLHSIHHDTAALLFLID